jgi:hypothetical protein
MKTTRWFALALASLLGGYHLRAARAVAEVDVPAPEVVTAEPATIELATVALPERIVPWDTSPALQVIRGAWENARFSEYKSTTRVKEDAGEYAFDCSGFVQWVLKQSHPAASRWAGTGLSHRPLARDYHTRIAAIAPERPRAGWSRVARVADIAPGDVIAWIKPREIESKNTGHVVFAVLPPVPLSDVPNTYLVRVADSTRLWHADDTRNWRGETPRRRLPPGPDTSDESPNDQGLGFGTISMVADPLTGAPVEYGWVATQWRGFATKIAIGRPMK